MNINDVNNPLIGGDLTKGKRVSEKRETDRTDTAASRVGTRQESDVQSAKDVTVRQVRDTYESTETRKLAAELTNKIGDNDPEPREEAVNRAKERIQTGYYNSPDFLDRLASTLLKAGVTSL